MISRHALLKLEVYGNKKYKLFPEICEKMSKSDVFTSKERSHQYEMAKLIIISMDKIIYTTSHNLFAIE